MRERGEILKSFWLDVGYGALRGGFLDD